MSRFRLRGVVRDLTGRTDQEFVRLMLGQVDACVRGLDLARSAAEGTISSAAARSEIGDVEHRGDAARERLVVLLQRAVVSPIDREDLFRLSRSVDDVLDGLRDFVREMDLLGVGAEPLLGPLLGALADGMRSLRTAVEALVQRPHEVSHDALAAKKNAVRWQYQQALAAVLDHEVTAATLKQLELLRRLDVVGLRLADAANALSDGAIKRCH